MKGCYALTALALTISIVYGNTQAQTNINCDTIDQADSTESVLTLRLACYNSELDGLHRLTQKLLGEREQLSVLMNDGNALAISTTNNLELNEQLETIEQLRLERSDLSEQLHRELIEKQEQLLNKESEERMLRNYSQAYLAIADENQELASRIKSLNSKIATLEAQRTTLTERSTALAGEISTYKKTITNLSGTRFRLSQDLEKSAAHTEHLKKQLSTNSATTEEQSRALAAMQSQANFANNQITQLHEEKNNLVTSLESLNRQIESLKKDQELLTQSNTSLAGEMSTYRATVADLSARKTRLINDLEKSASLTGKMKNQLLSNATLIQDQSSARTTLESEKHDNLQTINQLYNALASSKKAHTQDLHAANKHRQELNSTIESLASRNAALINTAEQAATDSNNALNEKLEVIATLRGEIQGLSDERIAVSTQLESADSLLAEKKDIIASLSAQTIKQRNDFNSLQAQWSSGEKQLQQTTGDLQLLSAENEVLKAQIASLNQQTEGNQTSIAQLQDENTTVRDSYNLLNTEKDRLTASLKALQSANDQLSSQLQAATSELEAASASNAAADTANNELGRNIESLQSELADTKSARQAADQAILDKDTALLAVKLEKDTAAAQVATLNTTVASLEKLLDESQNNNETVAQSLAAIKSELDASNRRMADQQAELQQLLKEKESIVVALNKVKDETLLLARTLEQELTDSDIQIDVLADNTIAMKIASSQLFRTGSSVLSADGKHLLAEIAGSLQKSSTRRILIEGHSDNVPLGPKLTRIFQDNLGLSMARATSGAAFFAREAGLPPQQLSLSGAGDTQPIATNETPEGRQKNRRVEIMLLPLDAMSEKK